MARQNRLQRAVAVLLVLVLASAMAVVYVRHLSRVELDELQRLQRQRDDINIEWGRLQLEQSTFATHSKIEQVARERLGMVVPAPEAIRMVRP